jgi:hypothetical protein
MSTCKDGESPQQASYRGRRPAKIGIKKRRRKLLSNNTGVSQHGGHSSRNTQHLIDHSPLPFAASISSNHHNRTSKFRGEKKKTHQNKNKISGQSVQAKNVNINAMDDMLLVFTVVRHIMTELSGVTTGNEKVAVITKPPYRLETLKCSLLLFTNLHRD